MQGKNKLMVAAAIGMVAVVVAATAVRCSAERAAEEAVPPEPARAEQAMSCSPARWSGQGPKAAVDWNQDFRQVARSSSWRSCRAQPSGAR